MRRNNSKLPLHMLGLITQLGITMMVPIFMCGWLGSYVSDKLGIPILMIVFLILGIIAGFKSCYTIVRRMVDLDGGKDKEDDSK